MQRRRQNPVPADAAALAAGATAAGSGDVLGQEVDTGAQELSEEEPAQQTGLVTALVVILVVFVVVIGVFFAVQSGVCKRKRGGKKMTGVDDLVRTSSA